MRYSTTLPSGHAAIVDDGPERAVTLPCVLQPDDCVTVSHWAGDLTERETAEPMVLIHAVTGMKMTSTLVPVAALRAALDFIDKGTV